MGFAAAIQDYTETGFGSMLYGGQLADAVPFCGTPTSNANRQLLKTKRPQGISIGKRSSTYQAG
jgi:hypothetical protein